MHPSTFSYRPLPSPIKRITRTQTENFKYKQHNQNISNKIGIFLQDRKFCDVVLIAGLDGVRVHTHRMILATASDYFFAMFQGWFSEANAKEVVLQEIDGVTLKTLVNFMYTGEMEIRNDTVENLLTASNIFQMEPVVEQCCNFIMRRLEAYNCLGVTLYAEHYSHKALYDAAYALACGCFTELYAVEEFYMMNVDQLIKFTSANDLCVISEEDVFRCITKWVNYDKENRDEFIYKILTYVRFPLLPVSFIEKEIANFCSKSDECKELIARALRDREQPFPLVLRTTKKRILYISVWFSEHRILSSEVYSPILKRWLYQEWSGKLSNRSAFSATVVGDLLIIAGGKLQNFSPTDIVELLNLKTLEWTELIPMHTQRLAFGMAELNGKVYAVGGRNNNGGLRSVERYDLIKRQWEDVAPTWEKHCENGVVALDGLLYVIGGSYSFECYNPRTNVWTRKATLKDASAPSSAAVVNGKLYAVCLSGNMVERYDPRSNSWESVSELGVQAEGVQCCGIGDCLIVNCGSYLVREFNTVTKEWRNMPPFERLYGKGILLTI